MNARSQAPQAPARTIRGGHQAGTPRRDRADAVAAGVGDRHGDGDDRRGWLTIDESHFIEQWRSLTDAQRAVFDAFLAMFVRQNAEHAEATL